MCKSKTFVCSVFSSLALVASATVDPTGYVVLTADDPGGTVSFHNDLGRWNPAGKPSAGQDYLVQGTASAYRLLRADDDKAPFLGDSLTLDFGEIRKSGPDNPCTVTNLIVYKGRLGTAEVGGGRFAGEFFLQGTEADLEFRGGRSRRTLLTAGATVHGVAGTTLTVQNSTDAAGGFDLPYYVVWSQGDLQDFHGTWTLNSTANATCRTALIASGEKSLGAMDEGQTVVQYVNLGGFFGDGLTLQSANARISAPDGLHLGSYTNGLSLLGGMIAGGGVLTVTNHFGTTTLGGVSVNGFDKLAIETENVRFVPGFANDDLPVEAGESFTIDFGGADPVVELGAVTLAPGAKIRFNYTGDLAALAIRAEAFSFPLAKIANFGATGGPTVADLDLPYVWGAAVSVDETGTITWGRAALVRPLITLSGKDMGSLFDYTSKSGADWSSHAKPDPANDYFVPAETYCRGRNTATFAGHSLIISDGGELSIQGGCTLTVNDMTLCPGGRVLVRGGGATGTLKGNVKVPRHYGKHADLTNEGGGAKLKVLAGLTGDGDLAFRGYDGGGNKYDDGRVGTIVFGDENSEGNENNGFTGRFLFFAPMTAEFVKAGLMGPDPDTFEADNITFSNNGVLQIDETATLSANRGLRLNGEASPNSGGVLAVPAGTTLTVPGVISGTGRLSKRGDGTLVLPGANTFSGGFALEGGDVVCNSSDAFGGASKFVYSSGVLRVACTGLKIGGEFPFSNPSVIGKTPVKVSVAAFDAFPNGNRTELFVLTNPWATFDPTMIDIQGFDEDEVVWTTEAKSDGLHVTARIRKGMVLIFK